MKQYYLELAPNKKIIKYSWYNIYSINISFENWFSNKINKLLQFLLEPIVLQFEITYPHFPLLRRLFQNIVLKIPLLQDLLLRMLLLFYLNLSYCQQEWFKKKAWYKEGKKNYGQKWDNRTVFDAESKSGKAGRGDIAEDLAWRSLAHRTGFCGQFTAQKGPGRSRKVLEKGS